MEIHFFPGWEVKALDDIIFKRTTYLEFKDGK
jgi:hypothetical protein